MKKVRCINADNFKYLTLDKVYDCENIGIALTTIKDDEGEVKHYPSKLFEKAEEKKEYSVMEVLEMPKGTILKLFPYDESERKIIVAEGIANNKYLYYIDDEGCQEEAVMISSWIMEKPRLRVIEEPKPVSPINYEEEYRKLKKENEEQKITIEMLLKGNEQLEMEMNNRIKERDNHIEIAESQNKRINELERQLENELNRNKVLKEKLDKEQSESAENFVCWGEAESKAKKLQEESNAFEKMADILKSKGEEKDKLIEEMKSENKNLKEALKKLVEVL